MLQSKLIVGRLDRRVTIQQLTNVPDEYNQPVPTWATLATVWASVDDKSGGEGYQSDQLTAYRSTVFTIRYRSGLDETMRIIYDSQIYNIRMIKSPDRKRTLEITGELLDDPEDVGVGGGFSSGFSIGYNVS